MLRLLILALVVVGLAPGTFVRTPIGLRSDVAVVSVTPLSTRAGVSGELTLTGAWELKAGHGWFGGFSALAARGGAGSGAGGGEAAALLAGTDRGWLLDLDLSGDVPRAVPGSFKPFSKRTPGRKEVVDLEALTHDPATGTVWAAFENANHITRRAPDGARRTRAPHAMAHWSANSGPETMIRLADGRFLVIAEGTVRGSDTAHEALLFERDPVEAGTPLSFRFVAPPDYDPVDATQVPDGRVLILLRRVEYAIPVRFDTAIAVADPRSIRAGRPWRARIIQRLGGGIFADNFEGIAFVSSARERSQGSLWLISDDNFSVFQRSLLVRFNWDGRAALSRAAPIRPGNRIGPNEKAPGSPDA
ncbi:MAG: esterase-like activity of phytase family protein [Sphingomonadales bacterium]|nr:esterase-like activity of phytase family protein [Sphingomonadales bacterium]NCQ22573.1 esterase-like activity of phytase family protein [Sphingomonadales bacterium]NCT04849.1 esterase-like activity of phytase family protein [Sphingomonadales bacterium]